jgi:hypothetical protein
MSERIKQRRRDYGVKLALLGVSLLISVEASSNVQKPIGPLLTKK